MFGGFFKMCFSGDINLSIDFVKNKKIYFELKYLF